MFLPHLLACVCFFENSTKVWTQLTILEKNTIKMKVMLYGKCIKEITRYPCNTILYLYTCMVSGLLLSTHVRHDLCWLKPNRQANQDVYWQLIFFQ